MKKILATLILIFGFAAPAWAVGTMIVMSYYGLATAGAMSAGMVAAAFVINYGVSIIVNRIFGKNPPNPQNNGVRQQIPPASTNSIPIVYGDAYLGGTFVDAVLSTNQQVMWYTMAISQVSPNGQFTFDKTKFYYGDRLITFDAVEPAKVISLTDGAGNVDTKIADNLYIYLYRSNEAGVITNLDLGGTSPGSGLPNTIVSTANGVPSGLEWNASNRQMNGLAFAIVKLIYSQDDEATSLQQLTFKCKQALNGTGVAKPGDVWYDYIRNAKYGGDVPDSLVNATSAATLNTYSDQTITFTNNSGNPATQARYRINGVINTGLTVLENIDKILVSADSWMAYDAPSGKWSIVVNKPETTALAFNDSNIVGDIRVSTVDINQAINQIEARFPNSLNKDIPDFVFLETPAGLLYPNEPVNKYDLSFDLVNDSVQAQYLANRLLEQAREDLVVTIKTTYAGIQINAGDVVSVTNSTYGWSAKLFRVFKVNEAALPDGTLGASLDLNEYNVQVYDDKDITQFQPSPNTGLSNPSYFSALSAPTVTNQQPNAAVPSFAVDCVLPSTGRVTRVLLYYTSVASPTTTDWLLLGLQQLTNGTAYANGSTLRFEHIMLPTGTYYFAFQVANNSSQSALSPTSFSYAWSPNPTSTSVGNSFAAAFSPPVLQVPYASGTPNFTGIDPQLYGTAGGAAIDFVLVNTDTDPLFLNNTWRIGASSTTGLSDIVKTNITIGAPTDGGNYAFFPTPTAMPANPATIEVPIRYKDATGVVYQSATAICQLTWNIAGTNGVAGDQYGVANLYIWSTSTPGNPTGNSTWTWATASNSSYTGTNGWSVSVPANPGTPGINLWIASKAVSAPAATVSTLVDWTSGFNVSSISQNGANGVNGLQTASPTVFQWAATIPAGPTGTSTYTWASNSFTPIPASWSLISGTSPSAGFTLWAAQVNLVEAATVTTSTINWTTATIGAVGYAGSTGATGTAGASSRICYARVASNPTPTAGNITTTGSATFPSSAQSLSTWGFAATWGATDPNPSSTNSLYQSDGIYNPATGNTVWSTPYISSLKVGTLSAITANLGTVTAGNITGVTITGGTIQTAVSPNARVALSAATNYLEVFNSSNVRVASVGGTFGGSIYGSGTGASGPAIYGISTNIPAVYGTSSQNYGVQAIGTNNNFEALYSQSSVWNGSNHAIRGINTKGFNNTTNTSGLVGGANNYDFYADGTGVNYGPFTGAHDVLVPIGTSIDIGYIVCDVQCIARKNISNTIFEVTISNAANQIPLGIIAATSGLLANSKPSAFIESVQEIEVNNLPQTETIMSPEYESIKNDYDLYSANAVGEGQVYVCGESGNITKGDLIVTSSIAGVGMKQSDNIVRNITVAKARESLTFDSPTETKLIACIYLCG